MPSMIGRWFSGEKPVLDEPSKLRREVRLGIAGAVLVVIGIVAAGVLYAVPIGKTTYTAELSEAQSVKAGDDVRLAGISVGKVKSLELKPDRVVMRFTVDSDVFVGDETTLDVRMLTVVGGHYVAVSPGGKKPLGSKVIPADRVRLPYSLVQTFQDATAPLSKIDGGTLRENLATLDKSITAAPQTLRTTLDTVSKFVDAIDRQRAQVSNAIAVADENVKLYDSAGGEFHRMIDNINLLETALIDKRAELREAIAKLTSVLQRATFLVPAWENTLKPMAQPVADAVNKLEGLADRLEPLINSAKSVSEKLQQFAIPDGVTVDQSGQTIQAPAGVCIPLPGKAC